MQKISYRLVHSYNRYTNRYGLAPVALECRQGQRKIYMSSKVMIEPGQWDHGKVVNHDNAAKLTVWLMRWKSSVESVELDALLKGRQLSLFQLKDAVRTGMRADAPLRRFMEAVMESDTSRCEHTKQGYKYLVNDMEKLFGVLKVTDVDYDLVTRYRDDMRRRSLSENTVKGRLKMLRCLMEQAKLRKLIDDNPFDNITIGNMTARVGYLEQREVRRLERLELTGREEKVRDLFLLSCYTGLRFSDLSTLEEAEIRNGMLRKKMKKTHHYVTIPIGTLFWGKGQEILDKYPDVRVLSHAVSNTTFNKVLKEIGVKAGIKKRLYCHLGRKTCSNMLNLLGMDIGDITAILGHTETKVTRKHYLFNDTERLRRSARKFFKPK